MLILIILATTLTTITWLSLLSLHVNKESTRIEDLKLSLEFKKLAFKRESQLDIKAYLRTIAAAASHRSRGGGADSTIVAAPEELPELLKELIAGSPDHDEIQEIDATDELIGVFFDSKYPPEFSDSE